MASPRTGAAVLLCCSALWGQHGTTPKGSPADYPAHANDGEPALGTEYLVHSVSSGRQTFVVPNYLVVEVALYPAREQPIELAAGQFWLRINGKTKGVLRSETPAFVAASLKHPDWEPSRGLQTEAGIGGIIIGRPTTVGRVPGDNREPQPRTPPGVPAQNPAGVERPPSLTAEEAVVDAALPEGRATGPVSGHLYFPYTGKVKSLKSLELIYQHGERQTILRLF
ncbi:MAG: hypothetical protein ABSH05_04815 [Bryobacteraceae bacterium]